MAGSTASTAAELAAIADNVAQYRSRVAGLAEPWIGTERDDVVTAIHEAERQLRNAERTLMRAIKGLRLSQRHPWSEPKKWRRPLVREAVARCEVGRRIPTVAATRWREPG